MAQLKDMCFSSSGVCLDFQVSLHSNIECRDVACEIKITFHFGNNQLQYDLIVLYRDVRDFCNILSIDWKYLLDGNVWNSTEPGFACSIWKHVSDSSSQNLYLFQMWIDAGEFYNRKPTMSGIGITIWQEKEAFQKFAIELRKEFEFICPPKSL